jgi:hypothetical protein
LATYQKGKIKAKQKELIKLIQSFLIKALIVKNRNRTVSAPKTAENKLSL